MLIVPVFSSNIKPVEISDGELTVSEVKKHILNQWGIADEVYLIQDGRRISEDSTLSSNAICAVPRLVGGKGGFGSMLRAIGAQIEKTTNREACRDLSGRRLRDINEEKRLKNWIAQQAEREREAAERRLKKLERLCAEPKHNFQDTKFGEMRSKLTEEVSSAVELGLEVATSSKVEKSVNKRKAEAPVNPAKKKKACLWVDPDEDELSSSIDSEESDVETNAKTSENKNEKVQSSDTSKHDSGNEDDTSSTKSTDVKKDEGSTSIDSVQTTVVHN